MSNVKVTLSNRKCIQSRAVELGLLWLVYDRNELISCHEDELATVTQLCQREIHLLMDIKAGAVVRLRLFSVNGGENNPLCPACGEEEETS